MRRHTSRCNTLRIAIPIVFFKVSFALQPGDPFNFVVWVGPNFSSVRSTHASLTPNVVPAGCKVKCSCLPFRTSVGDTAERSAIVHEDSLTVLMYSCSRYRDINTVVSLKNGGLFIGVRALRIAMSAKTACLKFHQRSGSRVLTAAETLMRPKPAATFQIHAAKRVLCGDC